MKKVHVIALFVCFAFQFHGIGQTDSSKKKGSLDEGTIESQYDYLWESSNRYQDHRVVKSIKLNKFKNNVLDSLNALHITINELNTAILSSNSNAADLTQTIDSLNSNLSEAIIEKDNFSILGTSTSKSSFKSLFWLITIGLSVLLLFIFFRLKSKISIAKEARRNFNLLEEEFEDFKKRAREKEQVLARQLQDEINKGL